MDTIILQAFARHVAALPLGERHRAEVYHAWESAPDDPLDFDREGAYDDYLHGEAGRAWRRVKDLRLYDPESSSFYSTTLTEMSFYVSAPTKTEILKALSRADNKLNGATP